MSILSGYKKVKNYIETGSGKKLLSRWTSSNTVEFEDGKTAQTKVGAIKGITTSTSATETGYAADATTVAALNQSLGNLIDFTQLTSTNNGCIKIKNIKIVWGVTPTTAFSKNTVLGLYTYNIDLTSYKFTGSLYANISCAYGEGIARVGFSSVSNTKIGLLCSSSVNGLYVRWICMGACTN